ncbi:glucose-1-phosphate adenylyltransferase family protein [Ornithinimicrobium sp. W1665]|uniref:glucose-1-phosphate adenylyltransferase family protein n=1 Tax=Ornithinimicrobium sp. W1665 TaxID=3416666 RepID=UPI003CF12A95
MSRTTSAPPSVPVGLRVLAIVQAGGAGSRMEVLTRERAKPALPFAGTHALVDFPLSALRASGIVDVWVSVQYLSGSLDTHLAGGRPWDLDRTHGGFRRLTPEQGSGAAHDDGFSHGNADGLFRMRDDVRVHDPDVLVVLSADHVFSADLRPAIAHHLRVGAECTVLTAQVGVQEAAEKMVVHATGEGRVTAVEYKPDTTDQTTVATEIFLYDPRVLLAELERLHRELAGGGADGGGASIVGGGGAGVGEQDGPAAGPDDTGLGDFGELLLPALVSRGRVHALPLEGYWRDVGRPAAYLQAHRDLLAGRVDVFDHPDRPVLSPTPAGAPAWVGDGGELDGAMVSPGVRVRGRVARSVLGPDVVVEGGAVVEDSVLMRGVVVEAGASLHACLVDEGVRIGRDAVVGRPLPGTRTTDGAITLVGRHSVVGAGGDVPAGARLEPGTTA